MRLLFLISTIFSVSLLFNGCIVPPDSDYDASSGDGSGSGDGGGSGVTSDRLTTTIYGIESGFLGLENTGQKYELYEDGIFTSEVKPQQYKISIFQQPTDSFCELYDIDLAYWNTLAYCINSSIETSSTQVPISYLGWSYTIEGSSHVIYSPEHIIWTIPEDTNDTNATTPPAEVNATSTFTPHNVGLFFNTTDGSEMQYIVADIGIINDLSPDGLQQGFYELLVNSGITSAATETYRHRINELDTVEYTITTNSSLTSTGLIRELAQAVRDRFVELGLYSDHKKISYIPTQLSDATTNSYRLGISMWPSGGSVLYMLRVAPSSELGDGEHFPTPDLKKK